MIHSASAELRQAMRDLSTELRAEMAAVRAEMATLSSELRGEMAVVRREMATDRADLASLRTEMRQGFDRMDQRFGWLVGIVITSFVATIGTIAGAFWTLLQTVR
jgi:predicted benzoate:H+ symporter BenE